MGSGEFRIWGLRLGSRVEGSRSEGVSLAALGYRFKALGFGGLRVAGVQSLGVLGSELWFGFLLCGLRKLHTQIHCDHLPYVKRLVPHGSCCRLLEAGDVIYKQLLWTTRM